MNEFQTVTALLQAGAATAAAICAPERGPLSYAELRAQSERTVVNLNDLGIGRGDRVAIVLPNGPEMATAFVSVSAAATTAPLNPAYRAEEFKFYLADLEAKALVVAENSDSAAVGVALELGIPVVELICKPEDPAGRFELRGHAGCSFSDAAASGGFAESDDVALVLHTSGTTARPKQVPLTHANLCASADNIVETLRLTEDDHCLNVMPLFHIHGLAAAILASLRAGGSVYCSPGFNALRFFAWIDDAKPTWYTAVPTMHQAILSRAARNQEIIGRRPLRFVRSSSASLPPQLMKSLEEVFGVPVIEAYAMTEAAHQMCCNPLPPGKRKPGSVGPAAGPEVAIMNSDGELVPARSLGEVVIRGANVTAGYCNNPSANESAFTNGWFRTGDEGVMDEAGYLRLTGRLKEIINRGGEKISPLEVDVALLDHPSIGQVCTFAVPHAKLGEDVAAAVVLVEGAVATEREIREFAAERLAPFKVPRTVVFCDEIPKGATGKIQRINLANKFGLG